MGYSVLYIAFGIVALWLLGEVLLQYKARLRWRLLAFAGFLGVVGGVALREVAVILLGAVAFGAGQTVVTLSYKRGFSTGWALGGRPGSSRRRRSGASRTAGPVLQVGPVEPDAGDGGAGFGGAGGDTEVLAAHDPLGSPDGRLHQPAAAQDGGEPGGDYPFYDGQSSYTPDPYTSSGYEGYGAQGYAGWGGEPQPAAASSAYDGSPGSAYGESAYDGAYGGQAQQPGWGEQAHGYGTGYPQQPAPAGYGYDYGHDAQAAGAGDWTPQPYIPQQPEPPSAPPGDGYGYGGYGAPYGYQADAQGPQPYIPQQQPRSAHDQQPQYTAEHGEQADPYDPYRY